MELGKKPQETYLDVGGLDKQIEQLIEAIVLPLTHQQKVALLCDDKYRFSEQPQYTAFQVIFKEMYGYRVLYTDFIRNAINSNHQQLCDLIISNLVNIALPSHPLCGDELYAKSVSAFGSFS